MKLIFPPVWEVISPYPSVPCLAAYLEAQGEDVEQIDMNLQVFDYIFSENYLEKCLAEALENGAEAKNIELLKYFLQNVEGCKDTLRSKKALKPSVYKSCRDFLVNCLSTVSDVWDGEELALGKYRLYGYRSTDANALLRAVSDIMDGKVRSRLMEIIKLFCDDLVADADVIGLSIASSCQVLPAMLLAVQCKRLKPELKIIMGGSLVTRWSLSKTLLKSFFEVADYFSFYEGELSLAAFMKFMKNEIPIEQVPSVAYMKDGEVVINPKAESIAMDALPTPLYDKNNLKMYFSPVPVLTLFTCRGCYWNKCAFCDHAVIYQDCYRTRSTELVVRDIETCMEKYGTKYFAFNDEAITAPMLKKLSKAIIEKNLDIRWRNDARFDKGLDKETLELAYKAGLRILFYGLESYNERVLSIMNKGIKKEWVEPILKASFDAGIWNHVYIISGFPTETEEEFKDTAEFVTENAKYIDSLCLTPFTCSKFSDVALNPQKYNINIKDAEESNFMASVEMSVAEDTGNLTINQRGVIGTELTARGDILQNAYRNTISVVFSDYLIDCSRNANGEEWNASFGTPLYSDDGKVSFVAVIGSDRVARCVKVSASTAQMLSVIYNCDSEEQAKKEISQRFGYPVEIADVMFQQIRNTLNPIKK